MKKIIICIFGILVLTGCQLKKDVFSFDTIQTKAMAKEYQYLDVTEQFQDDKRIHDVRMVATTHWQIEFYVFDTVESAKDVFENNQESFQKEKENTSSESSQKMINYQTYSLMTRSTFMYLEQVDNTLIYIHVPIEYRKATLNFLKSIKK